MSIHLSIHASDFSIYLTYSHAMFYVIISYNQPDSKIYITMVYCQIANISVFDCIELIQWGPVIPRIDNL